MQKEVPRYRRQLCGNWEKAAAHFGSLSACSFLQGRHRRPPEESRRPASLPLNCVGLHSQVHCSAATCIGFSATGLAAQDPGNTRSCSIRGDAEQCVANFLRFLTTLSQGPAPCNVNTLHYQPGPSSSAKPSVIRSYGHRSC